MQARLIDWLRMVIVSFEMFWLLVTILAASIYPDLFALIGERIRGDVDFWKALYAFPFLFATCTFKIAYKIRAPLQKEENKALYEWPDYPMLVDRVNLSLMYGTICVIAEIILWLLSDTLLPETTGAIFICIIGVGGISALHLFLAEIAIKEILTTRT